MPKRKRIESKSDEARKRKKIVYPKNSSKYKGVHWNKKSKKWIAQTSFNGKVIYCGRYTDELEAAHSINMKSDELGLSRKNIGIGDPPAGLKPSYEVSHQKRPARSEPKIKPKSKYSGVSHARHGKWLASVTYGHYSEGNRYHARYDSEETAAHAVNSFCDQLGIARINPSLGDPPMQFKFVKKKNMKDIKHSSKLCGVQQSGKRWRAKVCFANNDFGGGVYSSEKDAGHAANVLCDRLGLARKNQAIGDAPPGFKLARKWSKKKELKPKVYELSAWDSVRRSWYKISRYAILGEAEKCSKYFGVCWDLITKKWWAYAFRKNMGYCFGGCYENQTKAGHAANFLCDRLGIERLNKSLGALPHGFKPSIGDDDEQKSIQQMTVPVTDSISLRNSSMWKTFTEDQLLFIQSLKDKRRWGPRVQKELNERFSNHSKKKKVMNDSNEKKIRVKIERNVQDQKIPFSGAILSPEFDSLRRKPFVEEEFKASSKRFQDRVILQRESKRMKAIRGKANILKGKGHEPIPESLIKRIVGFTKSDLKYEALILLRWWEHIERLIRLGTPIQIKPYVYECLEVPECVDLTVEKAAKIIVDLTTQDCVEQFQNTIKDE